EPKADPSLAKSTLAASAHPASAPELATLGFTFTPPEGYTATGPIMTSVSANSGNMPQVTEYVQYFRKGSDLIKFQQGREPGTPSGAPITVAGVGRAYLTLDMTANSIEVANGSGDYARLEGADVNSLKAAATKLRAASSG